MPASYLAGFFAKIGLGYGEHRSCFAATERSLHVFCPAAGSLHFSRTLSLHEIQHRGGRRNDARANRRFRQRRELTGVKRGWRSSLDSILLQPPGIRGAQPEHARGNLPAVAELSEVFSPHNRLRDPDFLLSQRRLERCRLTA